MIRLFAIALCALMPAAARAELFPRGPAPLAADPAGIRVTLILPDGVSLQPGTAMLRVDAAGNTAQIPLSEPSRPVAENGGVRHLLQPTEAGQRSLADLQARFSANAPPASTMSVRLDLCRTVAAPAETPFLLSIRLAAGAPVLPLSVPEDGLSGVTGQPPARLAACP